MNIDLGDVIKWYRELLFDSKKRTADIWEVKTYRLYFLKF